MKMKLLKAWLRIKLRQWSSAAGLGILAITAAKELGFEVPPDLKPYIDTIGMGLAGIALFFMKESGETDAMKDAKHALVIQEDSHAIPMATPNPLEFRTDGVRIKPNLQAGTISELPTVQTGTIRPDSGHHDHGGFNG